MSTEAILMMVVAMVVLWGGLVLAVLNISRNDTAARADEPAAEPLHRDR